jgi:uncharacterized protein YqeY
METAAMADVRARMQIDLRDAMRDQDRSRVSVLRTALAALANAEAVEAQDVAVVDGLYAAEAERRELSDVDVRTVLDGVRDELLVAAGEIGRLGRSGDAERLRAQAAIVEGYFG